MLGWFILVAGLVLTTALHATAQEITIADDAKFLASVRESYEGSKKRSANPPASSANHQFDSLLRAQLWALVKEPNAVAGAGVSGRAMIDVPAAIVSYNTIHGQTSIVRNHINNQVAQLSGEALRISDNIEYVKKLSVEYGGMRGDEIYDDLNDLSDLLIQNEELATGNVNNRQAYTLVDLAWEMKYFALRYERNADITPNLDDPNNPTVKIINTEGILEFFKSAALGVNETLGRRENLNAKKKLSQAEAVELNDLNVKHKKLIAPVTDDDHTGIINYSIKEAWSTRQEFLDAQAAATHEVGVDQETDDRIDAAIAAAFPDEVLDDPNRTEEPDGTEVESEEAP